MTGLWLNATLLLTASVSAQTTTPDLSTKWVATWASSQQVAAPNDALPPGTFDGVTLRQIIHTSVAGDTLRLHLANTFGDGPLSIDSLHIARLKPGSKDGAIQPGTDQALTIFGAKNTIIPAGAEYWTDAIRINLPSSTDLVITMELKTAPSVMNFHSGSRTTSLYVSGDHVSDPTFTNPHTIVHWYFVAGVEVIARTGERSVVAVGDSITDGRDSITDGNTRWTDFLAQRLLADPATKKLAVLNQGIGGNCILRTCLGQSALERFDRDVIAQPGVRYLLVFEGVNDIGGLDHKAEQPQEVHDALVSSIEDAFRQMILRAHAHGILVYGCTITPFGGSGYFHPRTEADRQSINQWIRTSHAFDAVIDFDAALRDPAKPEQMAPDAESKDHLHPGPGGYKKLGDAIPIKLFEQ